MQKQKLDRFIQKYSLNGNVNAVKWKSNGNSLSTTFVTADKSLLGSLKMDNFNFDKRIKLKKINTFLNLKIKHFHKFIKFFNFILFKKFEIYKI